jgi:hypothetical protein
MMPSQADEEMCAMTKKKAVLIGVVATSTLYVGFAATTPEPKPNRPLSTRQKIAKAIKPKAVDKALDKIRDEARNLIMYEGAKHIGAPFKGGDEDSTSDIVEMVIDPREWGTAFVKIVAKASKPSKTASPTDDTPGADPSTQSSHLPLTSQPAQQPAAPAKTDTASQATQSPDRELVREHSEGPIGHGDGPVAAPASAPQEAPEKQGQTIELKAGEQTMQQAQQGDLVRGPDGGFRVEAKQNTPAVPVAGATPAPAAPAPAAPPAPVEHHADQGQGGGHPDVMHGAVEINHGVDKPDHNTPNPRDTGPPA